jgi:transcriptional regulator with XRE-family HTH domain
MIFEEEITQRLIGQRIVFLRGKFDLTQQELSLLSGVAVGTISAYENGTKNMGVQNVSKIATAFGMSTTKFFRTKKFARLMRFA